MPRRAQIAVNVVVLLLVAQQLRAQGIAISHDGIGCIQADKFPQFFARFDPSDAVSRARLHFRPAGWPHWYSVPMKPEGPNFVGVLPKPEKSLTRIEYYVAVTDKSFGESRSEEFSPAVVSGPAACGQKKLLAATLSRARSVIVSPPEGVAGLPKVPVGFSSDGAVAGASSTGSSTAQAGGATGSGSTTTATTVTGAAGGASAAGAAATTAAAAGAAGAGGGLSALGVAGIVAGGAAAATAGVVVATRGDDSINLTGRWFGSSSNSRPPAGCAANADYTVDLTQTGQALSGTASVLIRSVNNAQICGFGAGELATETWTGTIQGNRVSISTVNATVPPFVFSQQLTGTVEGNRMSGTGTLTDSGPGFTTNGIVDRWELVRQ